MKKTSIVGGIAKLLLLFVVFTPLASAAEITREFQPTEPLVTGNVVSVNPGTTTVSKTTQDNKKHMYGVVTEVGNIAFTSLEEAENVFVANSGIIPVLVSTVNGDIQNGDPVTVSAIAGIAEKATASGRIVGIAMTDLNAESPDIRRTSVEVNGENKEIIVGAINVRLGVNDYTPPTSPINQEDSANRNMLERIADYLAGKIVKPLGIIVAGLILLCGAFVATFLITSSSYSSMISIGRNPLAEKKVIKSLIGLIVLSIGIFGTSAALSYAALRLLG